jgi:PSP1 C-terminal conserved region
MHVGTCDNPETWGAAMGEKSYLIRYGVMSHVGRFPAVPTCEESLERGQLVVIQTDRGLELGEVLIATDGKAVPSETGRDAARAGPDGEDPMSLALASSPHVLRAAGPDDLSHSRSALAARSSRFSLCQRILAEGNWPWELVDVEPLLDGRATVLHYLGPHQIDVASLRARFRVECAIDVVLEPVGEDVGPEISEDDAHPDDAGGCGSCGCGEGGGCGRTVRAVDEPARHEHTAETAVTACAPSSHSGCSSCGIGRLMADRRGATS